MLRCIKPAFYTVGRGPVPRRAPVLTANVRGLRAAGVFRFGGEIAGGTRSHARVACEGPRATIKKTVLEPSQLCSKSGRRGTNAVSMQKRRDSLSTNHRRKPRGNGKHTVSENRAWAFCSAYAFFVFTKSQRCDKLILQETLSGLPRMPDPPAGTTVFALRPS